MEESWEVLVPPPEIVHSSRNEMNSSSEQQKTATNIKSEPKLCGFLNKLGEKGIIKTWKSRWFVFDESRCRLFYYRTPQDHVQLGFIDIATATFSFQVENPDRLNQFDICVSDRKYHLQAKDKQTMMFWLQELQTRRRNYSKKRANAALQNRDLHSVISVVNSGGLIGNEDNDQENTENPQEETKESRVMQRVPPPETVGQEAALKSPSGGGMFNLSFNNIRTEFRNMSAKRFSASFAGNTPLYVPPSISEQPEGNMKTEQNQSKINQDMTGNCQSSFQSHIKTFEENPNQEVECQSENASTNTESSKIHVADALRRKFAASRSTTAPTSSAKCQECEKVRSTLQSYEKDLTSAREKFQIEKSDNLQSDQMKLEDQIQSKDDYICKLEEQIRQQEEHHAEALKEKDKELCGLLEQIQMYQEMVAVKDQVVVSLTNELHSLEKTYKNPEGEEVGEEVEPESPTLRETQNGIDNIHEIDKLKEACQAYALQNRFINSEILELNKLRQDDEERLRLQEVKLSTAEAEMCKFKSKYLLVLRELQRPRKGGDTSEDDVIGQLLQDALDSESLDKSSLSRSVMAPYDRWGFPQKLNSQDEDAFLSMANRLGRRSEEIKANRENLETSNAVKWDNYMVTHQNREFQKTVELKTLIRSGITDQYRAHIWRQCIHFHVRETKKMAGPNYYQNLLESIEGKFSPAAKQIGLDLLRTLPNNLHYEKPDSPGIEKLRRVLLAYSWHNPEVGYCQGINRLVAIAMLYLTEEEAFWCLVAFIEHIMPKDYYSKTLLAAQADQRVLKDFLADKLPKVYAHLESLCVDLSLLTFNWFLTVFVDSFPIETILRTAFQGLNPFPMQKIRIKRRLYMGIVQAELDELDQLRDSYIHERDDNETREVLSDSEIHGDD
ncbi:TBC1 domain family member 2B [Exaiptasia diaphana]|nr:TBC1 domain family member 2B [Exaiptasia diaphana]